MNKNTPKQSVSKQKKDLEFTSDRLLLALELVCKFHNLPFSRKQAMHALPLEDNKLTLALFGRAAEKVGVETKFVNAPPSKVPALVYPFVVLFRNGNVGVVEGRTADPGIVKITFAEGHATEVTLAALDKTCFGIVIYSKPADDGKTHALAKVKSTSAGHWLWSSVFKFWPTWIYMILAAFVVNLLGLAMPLFVMNVYDRVIPNNSISTLWALVIGVGLALAIDFILRVMRSTLITNASRRIDMSVSSRLFEQAMDAKLSSRNLSSGELANHIREFESVRDFFTSSGLLAIIDLVFIGIFLAMLWIIVSQLAIVPLIAVPIVLIVTILLQLPLARAVRNSQSAATNRHSVLIESLTGIETVKSISAEGVMQKRWENSVARSVRASASIGFWSSIAMYFTAFVQQAVSVVMVTWGVFLIIDNQITVGALIASNILAGRVLAPLGGIAMTLVRLQQSFGALDVLNMFMRLERDHTTTKTSAKITTGKIEFRDVSFTYPDDSKPALDGVSLTIAPGERVAVLGKVGAGKSSVGKLLSGLYECDSGAIIIDDTDTRHYPIGELRAAVGFVGQETDLFTGTLRDNILIANPDTPNFEECARISGTMAIAQSHPLGFEMSVGERGRDISGGQRQSVAIARAMTGDHQILFMDEPTSHMDTMSEAAFVSSFQDWMSPEKTLIVSTHRNTLLNLVNRIIILEKGKVIADGPKDQVLAKHAKRVNTSSARKTRR